MLTRPLSLTAALLSLASLGTVVPGLPARGAPAPPRLRIHEGGRFLVTPAGEPVFLLADTAWGLARRLKREDVAFYLKTRREQGFNAVTFVVLGSNPDIAAGSANAYGDEPLALKDGRPDPARPLVTPGDTLHREAEYDFWDHVDYCVDQAAAEGMYVVLLPSWGSYTVGSYNGADTSEVVFDPESAYTYGRFLGDRYRSRSHVIWMLGGDRAAVNGTRDSRPLFRAMAHGIADGVNGRSERSSQPDWSTTLMSYHPRKGAPQSSAHFHDEPWLDFNSVQEWPESQVGWMERDWSKEPPKPTWLFEGRYENYHKGGFKPTDWGAWQMRQQAYQTVFSGAFGHTYGNEKVFGFGQQVKLGPRDPQPAPGTWQERLRDPGAEQMRHLARLLAELPRDRALDRVPGQNLIAGDPGKAQRLVSDRLTATRDREGRWALVYSASGRTVPVRMENLAGPADAYWYNPRTGKWHVDGAEQVSRRPFLNRIPGGPGTAVRELDPPGEPGPENDWVLLLRVRR